MERRELKVLILEDTAIKACNIKRALEECGICRIIEAADQEAGLEELTRSREQGDPVGLIVTDMSYPLKAGMTEDPEAGEILLKRLKEEGIELPVVLCSSIRYRIPEMAGCIRYREGETWELKQDFREIINRIMQ